MGIGKPKFTEIVNTGKTTGVTDAQGNTVIRNVYQVKKTYEDVIETNREIFLGMKVKLEKELAEINGALGVMPEADEPAVVP